MVQVDLADDWLIRWCEWVWSVGLVVRMGLVFEGLGFGGANRFCL